MSCGSLVGTVDLSDNIDFVATLEDFKSLFMLPYSTEPVSLGIHRVGHSLFIDGDPRSTQNATGAARSWEGGDPSHPPHASIHRKKKNVQKIRNNDLYSKFLYHSVEDSIEDFEQKHAEEGSKVVEGQEEQKQKQKQQEERHRGVSDEAADSSCGKIPGLWIHNAVTGEIMFKAATETEDPSPDMPKADDVFAAAAAAPSSSSATATSSSFSSSSTSSSSSTCPSVHSAGTIFVFDPETGDTHVRSTSLAVAATHLKEDALKKGSRTTKATTGGSGGGGGGASREPAKRNTRTTSTSGRPPHSSSSPSSSSSTRGQFRTVHRWNFHGHSVLLGSNLMIYHRTDNNTFVALKLHDVAQPFTRTIALSHWLDCIFANCPTLAICFHRNGRVLGYHQMRTQDIPTLKLRDLPVLCGDPEERRRRRTTTTTTKATEEGKSSGSSSGSSDRHGTKFESEDTEAAQEPTFDPDEVCARAAELLRTLQTRTSEDAASSSPSSSSSTTYCLFREGGEGVKLYNLSTRMTNPAQRRKWKYVGFFLFFFFFFFFFFLL